MKAVSSVAAYKYSLLLNRKCSFGSLLETRRISVIGGACSPWRRRPVLDLVGEISDVGATVKRRVAWASRLCASSRRETLPFASSR